MKESQLWSYLNQVQKKEKHWHFIRIESATVNGIPDVNCVMHGIEF